MNPPNPPASWLVWLYDHVPHWVRRTGVRLLKPTYPLAVAVVVFNQVGEVLILKHTYGSPAWRLPGGLVERREEVWTAAAREVREEASCTITPIGLVDGVATRSSFDLCVAAIVLAEHPFVVNPETQARQWVPLSQITGLPALQQRFLQASVPLWQNYRQNTKSATPPTTKVDG